MKNLLLSLTLLSGCGAVDNLANDAQSKLDSSSVTVTPTPTPIATMLPTTDSRTEVDVYVNVNVQQQTEQNTAGDNTCTGPVQMYLVLDRETVTYPWRVVAETKYQDNANEVAHDLIVQGYFQQNVSVVEQRDNSCVTGLVGDISSY